MNPLVYLTYDEWRAVEHHVRRGERSHRRNKKGEPVFSEQQVDADAWDEEAERDLDAHYGVDGWGSL